MSNENIALRAELARVTDLVRAYLKSTANCLLCDSLYTHEDDTGERRCDRHPCSAEGTYEIDEAPLIRWLEERDASARGR